MTSNIQSSLGKDVLFYVFNVALHTDIDIYFITATAIDWSNDTSTTLCQKPGQSIQKITKALAKRFTSLSYMIRLFYSCILYHI